MAQISIAFQAGDQVQTAPPAPPPPQPVMTILTVGNTNLLTGTSIECEWYINGARQTKWFKPADLHLVVPAVLPKT